VKFLSASFDMPIPVKIYQFTNPQNVTHSWRMYYDATIPYFHGCHLYYSFLAVFVLFIFGVLPTVILLLYPYSICQKCLIKLPRRCQLFLNTYVDSLHCCYKNGLEPGTRDCRWFSVVLPIFRISCLVLYGISPTEATLPLQYFLHFFYWS